MINVLLVDDQELVRTGIEHILAATHSIRVVGVAGTGEEAINMVDILLPDVVIMDINMPGIGGMEASRKIQRKHPKVKIIALSVFADGPIPQQLLSEGAQGYLSKSCSAAEMINAIITVYDGKKYISMDVANGMALSQLPGSQNNSPFEQLSQREMQIVMLTLQGRQVAEIAELLMISAKTVCTYRYRVCSKLGLKNDVELMRLALKYNLISHSS